MQNWLTRNKYNVKMDFEIIIVGGSYAGLAAATTLGARVVAGSFINKDLIEEEF